MVLKDTEYGLSVKGELPRISHVTSTGSTHSGMSVELADSPKHNVPRNLNMSFNAGPGITVKMNGASRAKFQISICSFTNNLHGVSVIDGGDFTISRCTISHNSHSGIHISDFSEGAMLIKDSEFERNRVHAILSVPNGQSPRSGERVLFQLLYNIFVDHDLNQSTSLPRHLVSLQNTAQKSGVWKISNNIFTKNKNMDHLVDITFDNGAESNYDMEISNSSFLDNEASVLSFRQSDTSASDFRLYGNHFRHNVAKSNASVVSLIYRSDQNAKLTVANNTFHRNSGRNILFVLLNESNRFSDYGVFEDGKLSENVMFDNSARSIVNLAAYGLRFSNNTVSNPRAECELRVPRFHTSRNVLARYTYWGRPNLEAIVERICGFDMDMSKAIVDYLPYRRSESWTDISTVTLDPFSLESVYGGQIVLDTELTDVPKVYPIKRSIYIR